MTDPIVGADYWGWVEPDIQVLTSEEPGLYAMQNRPQLASGDHVAVSVIGFITSASSISGASFGYKSVSFRITGYASNFPVHGDGLGNWGHNKESLVWIYDHQVSVEDTYIAIADTSARPIESVNFATDFTANLTYFSINGNGLWHPSRARSVPPFSQQVSFLAAPSQGSGIRSIYIINSTVPVIENIITADDLKPGAQSIGYYTWSPDGRYLMAQVDDRLVIRNRLTTENVLDVLAGWDFAPQFSDDGAMLFYPLGGVLHIRREGTDWIVDETVNESGTYTCLSSTIPFVWSFVRVSPSGDYWVNLNSTACGGAFDLNYRSFIRFFDRDFNLLASNNVSAFASGIFVGDFTNDSRWYAGGDGNINGSSRVICGPEPSWTSKSQGSSSTGAHHMRSFQAF